MPTPTQTFYNLKRLHVIFAVAALAMLAATVWMVAADHGRQWKRYQRTFRDRIEPQQRPSFGKWFLSLPFIDAFGRPLAIEQVWLPDLQINYNFCQVARFDRCTTCHQGIDKTRLDKSPRPLTGEGQGVRGPGSSAGPAYLPESTLTVQLATPGRAPEIDSDDAETHDASLLKTYGLTLAAGGILDPAEVTIGAVMPKTPAAMTGLVVGDVVLAVNGSPIAGRADFEEWLLRGGSWGKPLALEIRRGLPQPYSGHPRLDLYVGSQSPHPLSEFGCTACHDGQGSATEFKFASHTPNGLDQRARWRKEHGWFWNGDWDFPMRPKRFSESSCLKCHHDVTDLEPSSRFSDPPAPKVLAGYHLVRQLGCFGCHELNGVREGGERIGPDMRLEPSGTMRKVGPSLRHTAGRMDAAAIATWIADPADFRPTTRMPQLFGMHEHLDGPGLEAARRFEPVEIRAMTEYLLAASQPMAAVPPPAGITETPSPEHGKRLFRVQGCLACHRHEDFPEGQATQGPDLSRYGAMLRSPDASKWLASWIRDPSRHSPRTLMPNTLLEPASVTPAENQAVGNALRGVPEPAVDASLADPGTSRRAFPTGQAAKPRLMDPAADIAAYLMTSKEWQPKPLTPLVDADLDELASLYLSKTYPRQQVEQFIREGIPASMAAEIPPDAVELLGPMTSAGVRDKKLRYVGRRTIRKRGCFGCHDVPGMENAQPIGPALSDWGRKQESQLAFEQVAEYLARSGTAVGQAASLPVNESGASWQLALRDEAFYREAVESGRREGFIWQKLRAPRSFDYRKASDKPYNEHLLMGKFALTDAQREAIITFVLGLVAEPPKPRYVFHPGERGRAIVEGRKVLDQYGCQQCHTLQMERWTLEYDPTRFPPPPAMPEHDFLKPAIAAERVAASLRTDRRGLCRAELTGMPQVNAEGKPEETEDEDGKLQYAFTLWEPAVIAGKVWPVGGAGVLVSPRQIVARRPPLGGEFARLLYPTAVAEAKAAGSASAAAEAWGWVPPALVHEGRIVQPAWLYEYLLDPSVIRPAAVLRMPKFTLSPVESRKLVDYFAATAGAEFPYSFDPRARSARRGPATPPEAERLQRAMRFVTDRTTYCAKCHLVGDFSPGGEIRTTLAPNLEDVARRIRPDYLRRWLASPKSVLPYTAMPVNFPPDQRIGQEIYPGSSVEQLDAVMDLLLDYDGYVKGRVSIRRWIEGGGKGK